MKCPTNCNNCLIVLKTVWKSIFQFFFAFARQNFMTFSCLRQLRSSWFQGQSMFPSQTCDGAMHLLLPQWRFFRDNVNSFSKVFLSWFSRHTHWVSSVWSAQSTWPSHFQSRGIHLVRLSHWNPVSSQTEIWRIMS